MKKRILIAVLLLVFVAGLLIFLFPMFSGIYTDRQAHSRTEVVSRWIETARNERVAGDDEPLDDKEIQAYPTDMPQHHLALWRAARAYNALLWEEKQAGLALYFSIEFFLPHIIDFRCGFRVFLGDQKWVVFQVCDIFLSIVIIR